MSKKLILEKYIKVAVKKALKEQEEQQRKAEKAMYLVYRFPGLKKIMEDLMSPAFSRYINNITILSPKPTTFKVELLNNQEFSVKYLGKGFFNVKIAGKKYNPANIGELERASQSIADLLELNYSPEQGKEQSSEPTSSLTGGGSSNLGPDAASLAADLSGPESEPLPGLETPPEATPETPGAEAPTPPEGEETPEDEPEL